ncbi:MAG TPA: STAS domain-containing protein [Burkholderiales bacterium]|nr:STAS domain-containing protein [Burkholderiales bacterium]
MIEREGHRLRVKGPITLSNITALLEAGLQQFDLELKEIDFSQVQHVDSSAVSMLLEWLRQAQSRKLQLRVVNMPDNMQSLAALYGVLELIPSSRLQNKR